LVGRYLRILEQVTKVVNWRGRNTACPQFRQGFLPIKSREFRLQNCGQPSLVRLAACGFPRKLGYRRELALSCSPFTRASQGDEEPSPVATWVGSRQC